MHLYHHPNHLSTHTCICPPFHTHTHTHRYLWSLALAEKSSRWRIGVAFVCMLASKASGRQGESVGVWCDRRSCTHASLERQHSNALAVIVSDSRGGCQAVNTHTHANTHTQLNPPSAYQQCTRNPCHHAGLGAPLCLKAAVDSLSAGTAAVTLIPAVRWVLCFGLCGITQHLTKELTYPTFTPVSQVCCCDCCIVVA